MADMAIKTINKKSVGIKKSQLITKILLYIFLSFIAILAFFPFYIMIINATHDTNSIVTQINLLPGNKLFINFKAVSSQLNFITAFKNSIIISVISTLSAAYIGGLTAYAFSKFKFRGSKILFGVIIATMMFPAQMNIIGYFQIVKKLNLMNSLWAVILPLVANGNLVFFVKMYIDDTVPDSIIESARIDGCNEFKIFNRIILPMIKPSIATMSIFAFFTSWNMFIQPQLVLVDRAKQTVPQMAANAQGVYQTNFGAQYMIVAMSVVPIIIVYFFASKYIVSGLTAGAVKE